MMVYTTGKIGVDLLTDASDSRSSHRGCLRSAPGPPVKNGLGWWELHKMLEYCKTLQFQQQNRAFRCRKSPPSGRFLCVLVMFLVPNPFSNLSPTSRHRPWIPWPKLARLLLVFRRLALWHSCPTPSTMVEPLGSTDFDDPTQTKWQGFYSFLHGQMGDQAIFAM